ncbi:MAG: zinc ribbon domain-containing protein [Solirubrobacterales bacterium]
MTRPRGRDCPSCGENVKKGQTACPDCGYDFAAAATRVRPAPG